MKTAIILPTAFCTTLPSNQNREERISQYLQGFSKIAELVKKHPDSFDVFITDSTVDTISLVDKRLVDAINTMPNLKKSCFFDDNELGKKNKGVGLIIQWKKILSSIGKEYDYCISFEPRQKINNFTFFERFLSEVSTYFLVVTSKEKKWKIFPYTLTQVWTGLFSLKTEYLKEYSNQINLKSMVNKNLSVEKDLYDFIISKKYSYQKVENLGLTWHNSANDTYIEV